MVISVLGFNPYWQQGLGEGEVISQIANTSLCILLCRCSINDVWLNETHHFIAVAMTCSRRNI